MHLIISGRVQGVGYRAWLRDTATAHGLSGWVRNREDGTVEAVIAGSPDDVDAVIAACHRGPPAASVAQVAATQGAAPDGEGFDIRR
ncbi:MAG: acylphosphatase [Pacificimonas sp.]|nr:acylphosphatase [Pacificimonas sp.]